MKLYGSKIFLSGSIILFLSIVFYYGGVFALDHVSPLPIIHEDMEGDVSAAEEEVIIPHDLFDLAKLIFSSYPEYTNRLPSMVELMEDSSMEVFQYPPPCFSVRQVSFLCERFIEVEQRRLPARIFDKVYNTSHGAHVQKIEALSNESVLVIGDIHGSVHALLRNLICFYNEKFLQKNLVLAPNHYLIFTGDYIDRGRWGVEVMVMVMLLKILNPDHVFLIKGNHEANDATGNLFCLQYNFLYELRAKYASSAPSLTSWFEKLFCLLPLAVYCGDGENYIQFCHGGMPYRMVGDFPQVQPGLMLDIFLMREYDAQSIFIEENQTFLWGGFSHYVGVVPGYRGCEDVFLSGFEAFERYFLRPYGIRNVVRGHDHNDFVLSVLLQKEDGECWEAPLEEGEFTIKNYPFYTLMSCSEAIGSNEDGFAEIKITPGLYEKWTIKSYKNVLPPDRNEKYVECIEQENGIYLFKYKAPICS